MLLCLPLTILGCSGGAETIKWEAPLVIDFTSVSCPEASTATRAEFRRTTPRPAPDTTDADGNAAVSKRATQQWIDTLEVSERRKNAAGQALASEHDRCRGASPQQTALASGAK